MLEFNGKQYRNLEEQVRQNQSDIEYLLTEGGTLNQFGIKVLGTYPQASDLPVNYNGEYGDAFAIGVQTPYSLYIWTRAVSGTTNDYWFNIGPFPAPSTVPGPQGETGPQGATGQRGSVWNYGTAAPTATQNAITNDKYLNINSGAVYNFNGTIWENIGSIRGPAGPTGPQGATGPAGPQGPAGPTGPQGPAGEEFFIAGTLTDTSQLPDPGSVSRATAYLVEINGYNHLFVIEGENTLQWVDAGQISGVEGPAGPAGPQGPAGPTGPQGATGPAGADGGNLESFSFSPITNQLEYSNNEAKYNGNITFSTTTDAQNKTISADISIGMKAGYGMSVNRDSSNSVMEFKILDSFIKKLQPIGTIQSQAGTAAYFQQLQLDGWLLCDGSTFSQTTYPELYNALGTNVLPDLRGRILEGGDASNIGTYVEAGLPDIQGTVGGIENRHSTYSGAFTKGAVNYSGGGDGGYGIFTTTFKASNYNSSTTLYGKSSTVQPNTYKVAFIIKARNPLN